MPTFLTIARTASGEQVGKTYRRNAEGAWTAPHVDVRITLWTLRRALITSLADVAEHGRAADYSTTFVLGTANQPVPGASQVRRGIRTEEQNGTEPESNDLVPAVGPSGTIRDIPSHLFVADLDSLPRWAEEDVTQKTPAEIHAYAIAHLPAIFQAADCLVFFSSSHGTAPGKVRVHLWFWLSRPLKEAERKILLKIINAERPVSDRRAALMNQLIFVAPPVFVDLNPLVILERWHLIEGQTRAVLLPDVLMAPVRPREKASPRPHKGTRTAFASGEEAEGPTAASASGASAEPPPPDAVHESGEDRPFGDVERDARWKAMLWAAAPTAEGGPGFHDPITAAIGSYAATHGDEIFAEGHYEKEVEPEIIAMLEAKDVPSGHAKHLRNARNWWAEVLAREAKKPTRGSREPQPCPLSGSRGPTTSSVAEAESLLAAEVGRFFAEAENLFRARIARPKAHALALAAHAAGEPSRAEALAAAAGLRILKAAPFAEAIDAGLTIAIEAPDWPPPPPPQPFAVDLALGKTEQLLRGTTDFARLRVDGLMPRIAYGAATHDLLNDIMARFKAMAPDIEAAAWRGESAQDPDRPGQTMCPRAEERGLLRSAGADAMHLCGSRRRGFCPFHERALGNGKVAQCGYRAQRQSAREAQVVFFAGGSLLGLSVPEVLRWPDEVEIKVALADLEAAATIRRPFFDVVVIDEPQWAQLTRGLEESDAQILTETNLLRFKTAAATDTTPLPPSPSGDTDAARQRQRLRDTAGVLADLGLALIEAGGDGHGFVRRDSLAKAVTALVESQRLTPFGNSDPARLLSQLTTLAYGLVVRPKINPSLDQHEVLAAAADLVWWNGVAMLIAQLVRVVRTAMLDVTPTPSEETTRPDRAIGTLKTSADLEGRFIALRWAEPIEKTWCGAAIALLDATWHGELATPHLPGHLAPATPSVISAPLPADAAIVTQVYDHAVSHRHLKRMVAKPDETAWYAYWVLGRYAAAGGAKAGGGLLVTDKAFEEALTTWFAAHGGLPEGLETAHYGALRGIDRWKGVGWLGLIGRMLPPDASIWERRAVLTGTPAPNHSTPYSFGEAVWPDANLPGWGQSRPETVPRLEGDAPAQAILDSLNGDELAQAIGRARLLRRPGAKVRVDIMTNQPVPGLAVHQLVKWKHTMRDSNDLGVICAAKGVVPIRLTMPAEDYQERFWNPGHGSRGIIATLTGRTQKGVEHFLADHERPPLFDEILEKGTWIETDVQLKPRKARTPCLIRAESQEEAAALVVHHLGVAARVVFDAF